MLDRCFGEIILGANTLTPQVKLMQCKFIKSNGKQCNANAMRNSELCFTHNPETKEAKKEAVVRGGKSPKKNYNPLLPVKIEDSSGVVKLLVKTINEVRTGEIDLRVANCLGYLSGHLIKAMEVSDIEKRVEEIEKQLEERRNQGKKAWR